MEKDQLNRMNVMKRNTYLLKTQKLFDYVISTWILLRKVIKC